MRVEDYSGSDSEKAESIDDEIDRLFRPIHNVKDYDERIYKKKLEERRLEIKKLLGEKITLNMFKKRTRKYGTLHNFINSEEFKFMP